MRPTDMLCVCYRLFYPTTFDPNGSWQQLGLSLATVIPVPDQRSTSKPCAALPLPYPLLESRVLVQRACSYTPTAHGPVLDRESPMRGCLQVQCQQDQKRLRVQKGPDGCKPQAAPIRATEPGQVEYEEDHHLNQCGRGA